MVSTTARWRGVGAVLLFAAVLAGPAAARPLAAIEAAGTLRLGLTGDYPPYAARRPDGSFTGHQATQAAGVTNKLWELEDLARVVDDWEKMR
jgi:ABC-type amino acid transport substrate-binding protein